MKPKKYDLNRDICDFTTAIKAGNQNETAGALLERICRKTSFHHKEFLDLFQETGRSGTGTTRQLYYRVLGLMQQKKLDTGFIL